MEFEALNVNFILLYPVYNKMYGLLKKIGDATLVDKSINDLYPDEYHGVIKLPNGKYTWAQYMGPGSRIDLRVPKGQEGLTPIDRESMAHDIRYHLSTTPEAIRAADNKFNEVIDRLRKEGKEDEFNLKQAELIKVKVFLEGNEILRKFIRNFNTRKTDIQDTPELTKMFEEKLKKLEQEGYGIFPDPVDWLANEANYVARGLTNLRKNSSIDLTKYQKGGCDCDMRGSGYSEMYNYQLPRCNLMF